MGDNSLLIDVKDLHVHFKVYGGQLKVLDGVDFSMRRGERVGLVGETGCGKTTTMKAILRVLPTPPALIPRGQILFKDRDVLKMSSSEIQQLRGRGVSMIFQDPTAALNPVFTIGQQMEAVIQSSAGSPPRQGRGTSQGKLTREEIQQRAIQSLQEVALADPKRLLRSYPVQLSGGMRQRVCIGMALSTRPELLIADEPGTSLDVTIQDQVLRLLRTLVEERNTSVILITHTLGIVREMTDRVYVMYAGNMVEVSSTGRLFERPLHPYTRGLMDAVPRLSGGGVSDGIPGRLPSYLTPPAGCRFHPRCPHVMDICRNEKPPLYQMDGDHRVACFLYLSSSTPQGQ